MNDAPAEEEAKADKGAHPEVPGLRRLVEAMVLEPLVGTVFADRIATWRGRRAAIGAAAAIFVFAALLHACVALMLPKLVGSCVVPPTPDTAAAARDLPVAPPFAPAPPRPPPHAHPPPHARQRHSRWSSGRSSSNPPPCAPLLSLLRA